jgi:hypothetical protein
MSSKNKDVFIRDLSDLTLHIIFDAWWAWMNVGSKRPIAWKNSRHVPSGWFYLHCGIEETGSPGIICLVCHQLLRHPSEHVTSSIRKHLLAQAHITKLNELTESEVTVLTSSMAGDSALAILKRQGSRGITIVSLQRKTIFDIQFNPYWPKWQTKRSKLAHQDFENSQFHRDRWNCYLMLGFVTANIPWNAISNLNLRRSYMGLRVDLVLPSATTLSNICWRQYTLHVDAINKQLPIRSKVSLALDGWTSTNKLAITSVMVYYIDRDWASHEVQLAFVEVDRLFYSCFKN